MKNARVMHFLLENALLEKWIFPENTIFLLLNFFDAW